MFDIAAQCEETLEAGRDVRLHVQRRHPRIKRGDDRDRDVEIGENVDRHTQKCRDAEDYREQRAHDHGMRIAQ